jgi:hypothetical protein
VCFGLWGGWAPALRKSACPGQCTRFKDAQQDQGYAAGPFHETSINSEKLHSFFGSSVIANGGKKWIVFNGTTVRFISLRQIART